MIITKSQRFCGREFSPEDLLLIQEVVQSCKGLSRTELAHTVSELLEWKRPGDRLKGRECLDLLERLAEQGMFELPISRSKGKAAPRQSMPEPVRTPICELTGSVEEFTPLDVELVQSSEQRQQFKGLLNSHHYLGYAMPYGARLQYLV